MPKQEINSDLIRGHIDAIILRILQDGDNYGYEIMKAVSINSGRAYELKEPSLYTSLKRLEKQGLIVSYWGGTNLRAGGENTTALPTKAPPPIKNRLPSGCTRRKS